MVAIIDGDFIPYQVGFSLAKFPEATLDDMRRKVDFIVSTMLRNAKATGYIAYLGGKGNFRYEIAEEANKVAEVIVYKNNRPPRPDFYMEVKKYLVEEYNFNIVDGMEADDACSITLTTFGHNNVTACLLSQDKDLLQTPGLHYHMKKKGTMERIDVTFEGQLSLDKRVTPSGKVKTKLSGSGTKFLWAQMLMGDMVDSIRGIPKCGPVKTYNYLKDVDVNDMPLVVWNLYVEAYKDDADIFFNTFFQMLFMLRTKEDFVIPSITKLNNGEQNLYSIELF